MEQFKIENFEKEHSDKKFPWFRSLNESETKKIRDIFCKKVNLPENTEKLVLTKKIYDMGSLHTGLANISDIGNLNDLFNDLQINHKNKILVNWHQYDEIDELFFDDLVKYFDDIWYPAVDDIEIFDKSFSWVIFIGHEGSIMVLKGSS